MVDHFMIASSPIFLFEGVFYKDLSTVTKPILLSIIELGGYPDFSPVYKAAGYEVTSVSSMRKAISTIKKNPPSAIIAEFNFQSDFRDRTSTLESLMATLQGVDVDPLLIVFFEKEFATHFKRVQDRFNIHHSIAFPVTADQLAACLSH